MGGRIVIRSKDNEMYEIIKDVIVNATAEGADIKWGGGYKTKEVLEWSDDKLKQS